MTLKTKSNKICLHIYSYLSNLNIILVLSAKTSLNYVSLNATIDIK